MGCRPPRLSPIPRILLPTSSTPSFYLIFFLTLDRLPSTDAVITCPNHLNVALLTTPVIHSTPPLLNCHPFIPTVISQRYTHGPPQHCHFSYFQLSLFRLPQCSGFCSINHQRSYNCPPLFSLASSYPKPHWVFSPLPAPAFILSLIPTSHSLGSVIILQPRQPLKVPCACRNMRHWWIIMLRAAVQVHC